MPSRSIFSELITQKPRRKRLLGNGFFKRMVSNRTAFRQSGLARFERRDEIERPID